MSDADDGASVHFFIRYTDKQIAYRRMYMVPRVGDLCVFDFVRYQVEVIEWCLDKEAYSRGVRVNAEVTVLGAEGEKP